MSSNEQAPVVTFHLNDESASCVVTRENPESSWVGDIKCPICGSQPMKIRSYHDDLNGPHVPGYVTKVAWCSGKHESVGYLREKVVPGKLWFMGLQPETFRCRVF